LHFSDHLLVICIELGRITSKRLILQSEQGQVVILIQVNSCVMLDSSFVTAKIEIFLLDHFTS
jgi:hypothetical protein